METGRSHQDSIPTDKLPATPKTEEIERAHRRTLEDLRTRQDTIPTGQLPAIPKPEDLSSQAIQSVRSAAFRTTQFDRPQENESDIPSIEVEIGTREAIEAALIVVLESLLVIKNTPIYKDIETISAYKNEFAKLLGILRNGEIGTEGLLFHLNQRHEILKNVIREFPVARCIRDLQQSLQICEESKRKLQQKLQG